jgi:hypothetical protein
LGTQNSTAAMPVAGLEPGQHSNVDHARKLAGRPMSVWLSSVMTWKYGDERPAGASFISMAADSDEARTEK